MSETFDDAPAEATETWQHAESAHHASIPIRIVHRPAPGDGHHTESGPQSRQEHASEQCGRSSDGSH
jgi:hypothetical protein